MRDLNNMTVMITGASAGFGMVTAKMLVEQGANVVLGARRVDRLQTLSEELGEENVAFQEMDVSNKDQVHALAQLGIEKFKKIKLGDRNISEIVSVTDSEGHEYFEVDYLSQDTVFRSIVNKDPGTRQYTPNVIVATSVPRRFITFNRNGQIFIKFGYSIPPVSYLFFADIFILFLVSSDICLLYTSDAADE